MNNNLFLIPHSRGFKIASLSIVSLPAHIDELRLLMEDQNLDVLAINETRLSESFSNMCIHFPGYDIVRRDRNRALTAVVFVFIFAPQSTFRHKRPS